MKIVCLICGFIMEFVPEANAALVQARLVVEGCPVCGSSAFAPPDSPRPPVTR